MKCTCILDTDTNSVNIEFYNDNKKSVKEIGTNDFIDLISSTTVKKNKFETVVSPIMNDDTDIKLIQWAKLDKKKYLHIFSKKASKNYMQIYDDSYGFCGYPTLIFGIVSTDNNFTRMFVTVTKDTNITENTQIYKYPFSNVNNSSFSVCTGMNRFAYKLTEISDFKKVIDSFFYMPNTFESYSLAYNSQNLDFRALAELLKDKEFDNDLLLPNGVYKSFIAALTR